jgi:hypothetical protein
VRAHKLIAIFLPNLAGSYVLVLTGPQVVMSIVRAFLVPCMSILVGLMIGSIGVFLGGLGNLYTILQLKRPNNQSELADFYKHIKGAVNELKQNVLFVVFSFAGILILMLFLNLDIPYVRWPFAPLFLSKKIILTTIMLFLFALVFRAIIDSVKAMFRLHSMYEIITH